MKLNWLVISTHLKNISQIVLVLAKKQQPFFGGSMTLILHKKWVGTNEKHIFSPQLFLKNGE